MSDGLDLAAIRARAEADLLRRVVQGETSVVDPATTLALVDELETLRAKIAAVEGLKVQIDERMNEPSVCRVWRDGVLVFHGRSLDAEVAR